MVISKIVLILFSHVVTSWSAMCWHSPLPVAVFECEDIEHHQRYRRFPRDFKYSSLEHFVQHLPLQLIEMSCHLFVLFTFTRQSIRLLEQYQIEGSNGEKQYCHCCHCTVLLLFCDLSCTRLQTVSSSTRKSR